MNEKTPPLVMPPDLHSLPTVYEHLARRVLEALEMDGSVQPSLLLVSLPPGTKEPAALVGLDPRVVHALQRDGSHKHVMMALVRSLLDSDHPIHASAAEQMGAHPNLIVHISESWVVTQSKDTSPEAAAASMPDSLADHPNRSEAVTITMHSLRGTVIGLCPMSRDEDGKPSAVIEPLDLNPGSFTGRFNVHDSAQELPHDSLRLQAANVQKERPQ